MAGTGVRDRFAMVPENASQSILPGQPASARKPLVSRNVGGISCWLGSALKVDFSCAKRTKNQPFQSALKHALVGMALIAPLSGCTSFAAPPILTEAPSDVAGGQDRTTALWRGNLTDSNSIETWGLQTRGSWGLENLEIRPDPGGRFERIIRVRYPAGSASPAVTRQNNAPLGGAQFYANLGIAPQNRLRLSYYLRFSENFDFVKGGKLPGLFGGEGASGGDNPNGTDGFSTRFMWRRQGDGEVYAYLPTSADYGTSIGRGSWRFRPGVWHHIEQEVTLNQPNRSNGRVRVWFDGALVLNQEGLRFRTVDQLQVNGLFFSTFFGGNDPSWATPQDVYIDFADFSVSGGSRPR